MQFLVKPIQRPNDFTCTSGFTCSGEFIHCNNGFTCGRYTCSSKCGMYGSPCAPGKPGPYGIER